MNELQELSIVKSLEKISKELKYANELKEQELELKKKNHLLKVINPFQLFCSF